MGWQHASFNRNALMDERPALQYFLQDFFGEENLQKTLILMDEYDELAKFVGYELRRKGIIELLQWYCDHLDCNGATSDLWDFLCGLCPRHPEIVGIFRGMEVIQ